MFIAGPPASGKTTLARALASGLGAAVLDIDVATGLLTSLVLDLIGARDYSDPRAAELTRARRYETLINLARDNALCGLSTVLVAPFTVERSIEGWESVASSLNAQTDARLIWLTVAPGELKRRLLARDAARDADKLEDPDAWLATVVTEPPAAPHLALDGTRPVEELVESVVVDLQTIQAGT